MPKFWLTYEFVFEVDADNLEDAKDKVETDWHKNYCDHDFRDYAVDCADADEDK